MADDFPKCCSPRRVALRGSGGPQRLTEIVTLASGREHRNGRWAIPAAATMPASASAASTRSTR